MAESQRRGVDYIVALRGDPPDGVGTRYEPHPGGYETTADLVAGIRAVGEFDTGHRRVAPEAGDTDAQAKVDAVLAMHVGQHRAHLGAE